ncbi:DUF6406 domain-containing protein [Streptomyces scabiei]|uniref:DUF6406 domain-containing protein n=1 Tax=Streptomyces scabiei TaxID=1930 RepID=UPI0038F5E978
MINLLALRRGTQGTAENASFIVRHVQVPEDRPAIVHLVVVTDGEREFELRVGDTFPVRDATWVLDRVQKPNNSDDRYMVLRKVE